MFKPVQLELTNITTHEHTVYDFRQGVPTLIVGKNEDDPSQKGNGSGKSGFIEGVAIAVVGSPVRKASNKEMVRRGCEFGEVKFTLTNTMYNCELVIWRRLHVKESARCRVWENGEEKVVSDVNEYNKLIFSYLAITKEDFFNFYLLTQATYTPFFNVGDVQKKEIVNRFSGADKVDNVKGFIEQDVAEVQLVVNALQRQLNVNAGKQELLSQQIDAENEKYSEEGKARLIEERESQLFAKLDQIEKNQQDIIAYEAAIADWQNQIKSWNVQYDVKILEQIKLKEPLDTQLAQFKVQFEAIKQSFNNKLIEIDKEVEDVRKQIAETRGYINDGNSIKADLEKQLHGTIECPKCHHKFFLKGEELSWEEANDKLTESKELVEELDVELIKLLELEKSLNLKKSSTQDELTAAGEAKRDEAFAVTLKSQEIDKTIASLKEQQSEQGIKIRRGKSLIDSNEATIERVKATNNSILLEADKLEKEIESIREGNSDALDTLESQLLASVDEASEIEEKMQVALDVVKSKEEWHTNFKNFKSFLANQSIKTIEDYTNMFLQKMGTNLSIAIEGYKLLSSKKMKEQITVTVMRNGLEDASYGTFSGGERARIDVAVILAIQSLINLNATSGGIDLLFIDEVMDSVDSLGMLHVIEGLKNVGRTVCIVSQVEINALSEDTLVIQKNNQVSKIIK